MGRPRTVDDSEYCRLKVSGLTNHEIAEKMGVTEQMVRKVLHRADAEGTMSKVRAATPPKPPIAAPDPVMSQPAVQPHADLPGSVRESDLDSLEFFVQLKRSLQAEIKVVTKRLDQLLLDPSSTTMSIKTMSSAKVNLIGKLEDVSECVNRLLDRTGGRKRARPSMARVVALSAVEKKTKTG